MIYLNNFRTGCATFTHKHTHTPWWWAKGLSSLCLFGVVCINMCELRPKSIANLIFHLPRDMQPRQTRLSTDFAHHTICGLRFGVTAYYTLSTCCTNKDYKFRVEHEECAKYKYIIFAFIRFSDSQNFDLYIWSPKMEIIDKFI